MKKALMLMILLATLGTITEAQVTPVTDKNQPPQPINQPGTPMPAPCPNLAITKPQQVIRDGATLKLSVNLGGGDPRALPLFVWSISSGSISSGQGTSTIEIDSTGAGADKEIRATLQASGLSPECQYESTATITVAGPAKKVDAYGNLPEDKEKEHLDAFIANVTDREQAYIFAYAGRTSPRGQASADIRRIRAYLLKAGTPSDRIVTIDGGFREEIAHDLYIVPIGAESPRSSPTVNAKDIVYPKPTPTVKKP